MKREDIKPEELEGLLVAFADRELDEPYASEVADLISEHADLAVKVEEYMSTGDQLKIFFDTEHVETPTDIAERILRSVDKAEAVRTAAKKVASKPSGYNLISFFSSNLSITSHSLTQMAAALVIGVFLGPSLFEKFGSLVPDKLAATEEQRTQYRGASDVSMQNGSKIPLLLAIVQQNSKNNDNTKPYIYSGGTIATDTPFTILITSPLAGRLEVFDITDGKAEPAKWIIEVQEGAEITIPAKVSEISDQDTFVVRLLFSNDVSKVQIEASFILAPL